MKLGRSQRSALGVLRTTMNAIATLREEAEMRSAMANHSPFDLMAPDFSRIDRFEANLLATAAKPHIRKAEHALARLLSPHQVRWDPNGSRVTWFGIAPWPQASFYGEVNARSSGATPLTRHVIAFRLTLTSEEAALSVAARIKAAADALAAEPA